MKIFEFRYNSCIHESVMGTISLHKTRKGAEKALQNHKEQEKKEFEELWKGEEASYLFGDMEHWDVVETEIQT